MKISVIIPAHNEERYIGGTLEALLAQDHPDFEVIVVNNASTDRTAEIVRAFSVKLLNEEKKGVQWAREKGRSVATGEIIANLDADCLPDKDWLTRAERHFSDPKVAAVSGPYDYYDSGVFFRDLSALIQRYIYSFFNSFFNYFHAGGTIIFGNCMTRAKALEKIGGYNTSIEFYGDDTDMAKEIGRIGRIVFDRDLIMKSSARRFRKKGILKLGSLYIFHFFKGILFKERRAGNI